MSQVEGRQQQLPSKAFRAFKLKTANLSTASASSSSAANEIALKDPQLLSILFYFLVAVNCAWVLSLPLFPSQDGPVHLYYLSVINHLLSGSDLFSQYFAIRHPLPPYSCQYLLLFVLSKVMSPLLADKVVVCLFVVLFCSGFRYLVTSINPSNKVISFCSLPLSLNWMLGMGFVNYSLSLAFSLFAIGLWIRAGRSQTQRAYLLFLGSIFLILFTHPVPLFIVIAFVWGDTLLRVGQRYFSENRGGSSSLMEVLRPLRKQFLYTIVTTCSLGYISLFVNHKQETDKIHQGWIHASMIRDYIKLHPIVMTWGTAGASLYRLFLFALVAAAFFAGFRTIKNRFQHFNLGAADLLLVGAFLLAVFYPVVPRSVNGSDYFADRLVLYIWLFAIAGASIVTLRSTYRLGFAALLACVTLFSLVVTDKQVRSASRVLMKVEEGRIPTHGEKGFFIYSPIEPGSETLTFNPYVWSAARYFRRTDTVMLNAPWLDLPILPVAPAKKLFAELFPPKLINYPDFFAETLIKKPDVRQFVSDRSDFILFVGFTSRDPSVVDNVLKQPWPRAWDCNRTAWYSVCAH